MDYQQTRLFQIYFIELDADRQVIAKGVYPKKYKYPGNAYRIAREKFGDRNRYDYEVSWRDPWTEYSTTTTCDICGKEYERPEDHYGHDRGQHVDIRDRKAYWHDRDRNNCYFTCPDCTDRVRVFISSLKAENSK